MSCGMENKDVNWAVAYEEWDKYIDDYTVREEMMVERDPEDLEIEDEEEREKEEFYRRLGECECGGLACLEDGCWFCYDLGLVEDYDFDEDP